MKLTPYGELAAFEGMFTNAFWPMPERLQMAQQVIDGLRTYVAAMESYLRLEHEHLQRHDQHGVNLTCKGCALLAQLAVGQDEDIAEDARQVRRADR